MAGALVLCGSTMIIDPTIITTINVRLRHRITIITATTIHIRITVAAIIRINNHLTENKIITTTTTVNRSKKNNPLKMNPNRPAAAPLIPTSK
jgi:hypothetical protein